MAKKRTGEKVSRVVRFLLGLEHPIIARRLAAHGFDQAELDRAWTLIRGTVGQAFAPPDAPAPAGPRVRTEDLLAWQSRWLPIASAALTYNYPDVHARFFHELSQGTGLEVVMTLTRFVARFRELPTFPQGRAARALLEERGLTEAVIAEADDLLAALAVLEPAPDPRDQIREDRAAAEKALWTWYLEWSAIARAIIKEPYLLRRLGFRGRREAAAAGGGR